MNTQNLSSDVYRIHLELHSRTESLITDGEMIIKFGKHSDKTYTQIYNTDKSYCNWIIKQNITNYEGLLFKQWIERVNFILRRN
jgi:hypothetical protein